MGTVVFSKQQNIAASAVASVGSRQWILSKPLFRTRDVDYMEFPPLVLPNDRFQSSFGGQDRLVRVTAAYQYNTFDKRRIDRYCNACQPETRGDTTAYQWQELIL